MLLLSISGVARLPVYPWHQSEVGHLSSPGKLFLILHCVYDSLLVDILRCLAVSTRQSQDGTAGNNLAPCCCSYCYCYCILQHLDTFTVYVDRCRCNEANLAARGLYVFTIEAPSAAAGDLTSCTAVQWAYGCALRTSCWIIVHDDGLHCSWCCCNCSYDDRRLGAAFHAICVRPCFCLGHSQSRFDQLHWLVATWLTLCYCWRRSEQAMHPR